MNIRSFQFGSRDGRVEIFVFERVPLIIPIGMRVGG